MVGIVDCNSFYCACHAMFDAYLWDKPVITMSNNDEVVVSLNAAAKKIGLKRGMLKFENQELINKYNVQWFSSNYELYNDMSDRVMITISELVENLEVYSVDEAFVDLKGFKRIGLNNISRKIVDTVQHNTGITVSLGVAETKTLAKIANRIAKKKPEYEGVYIIDTEEKRIECLKETEISDVWGIGREISKKLIEMGVKTAYDFTLLPQKLVRKIFTVTGERTWYELQGIKCFDIETTAPDKKQIATTRSFKKEILDIDGIKEAVSTYAAICAADLRKQNAYAVSIQVFLLTNRFKKSKQYELSIDIDLPFASNTSHTLVKYALKGIEKIYLPDVDIKKAGVIVTKITKNVTENAFESRELDVKFAKLSPVEDFYSHGFDRKLLSFAVMGYENRREEIGMRQEHLSPCYTTRFADIMRIDCT